MRSPTGIVGDRTKSDGVVYTPEPIVELILDRVGFSGSDCLSRRLIDPSCGTGAFLLPAAERLFEQAASQGFAPQKLLRLAERNITGAELDPTAAQETKAQLDRLAERFGLSGVSWNVRVGDSLQRQCEWNRASAGAFDCVVGNPPYVRIQNLGSERRKAIQRDWATCTSGSTDLFIAFFELGIEMLAEGGKLGYITPRSYFSSEAGSELRRLLLDSGGLRELIDFGHHQVFSEVTTYTAITVFEKLDDASQGANGILIEKRDDEASVLARDRATPHDIVASRGRWAVRTGKERDLIKACESRGPALGDMCAIRVGLATLADRIYVLRCADPDQPENDDLTTLIDQNNKRVEIEAGLLRKIVKVSRLREGDGDQGLRIIFPYAGASAETLELMGETSFRKMYPKGYAYLSGHRKTLETRGHSTSQWYEFGSSQGIRTCFGSKLLVPPMAVRPRFIEWRSTEFTFYSGYGIFFNGDLGKLHHRLLESDFEDYVKFLGRSYRGGYIALSKRVIEGFTLEPDEWLELGAEPSTLSQLSLDVA